MPQILVALLGRRREAAQHGQRDHLVAAEQAGAADAGRIAALELAHVGRGEADRAAVARCEQDVVFLGEQGDADQPILRAFLELHRDLARGADVGEGVHRVAPHRAACGREHHVELAPFRLVFRKRQYGRDGLAFGERQQVDHRTAACLRCALGQAPYLQAVDLAVGREEQDRRVGRGHEQFGDRILLLGRHSGAALAAAGLRAEGLQRRALDVTAEGHGHDHVLALDQILVLNPVPSRRDLGDSRRRVGGFDLVEFVAHHREKLHPVAEDFEQFADRGRQLPQLPADLVAAKRGEPVQAQV